jgi:hypothetical protein
MSSYAIAMQLVAGWLGTINNTGLSFGQSSFGTRAWIGPQMLALAAPWVCSHSPALHVTGALPPGPLRWICQIPQSGPASCLLRNIGWHVTREGISPQRTIVWADTFKCEALLGRGTHPWCSFRQYSFGFRWNDGTNLSASLSSHSVRSGRTADMRCRQNGCNRRRPRQHICGIGLPLRSRKEPK